MKAKAQKSLLYGRFTRSSTPPAVIKFLIKNHIVKDEKQAQVLLIVVIAILVVFSVYLITIAGAEPAIKSIPIN